MPERPSEHAENRRVELLYLLTIAGTLAGVCVTALTLIKTLKEVATIVDDMFAACTLLFLVATYLAFAALKVRSRRMGRLLVRLVDVVFLVGLTVLTIAALIMTYTIW